MDVSEAIRAKRAVREFTDESLPAEVIHSILDAGRRSQSSKNSQPWDFVVVMQRERLQKLATMGDWMGHVAGAAMCVAIVTPVPGERFAWHMFDAGQCAAYLQLAAWELGVGSCLGTVYKPDETRDLLGLPEDKVVTIVISFGYPKEKTPSPRLGKKGRRAFDEVVHWETW